MITVGAPFVGADGVGIIMPGPGVTGSTAFDGTAGGAGLITNGVAGTDAGFGAGVAGARETGGIGAGGCCICS